MKFVNDQNADISGTHLQGYVTTTYQKLVETFGAHDDGDGYKQDAQWILIFHDGTLATVYNYKDGKNYMGAEGDSVENITDWHIGGENLKAVEYVKAALK